MLHVLCLLNYNVWYKHTLMNAISNLFSGSTLSMFLNSIPVTGTVFPNFKNTRNKIIYLYYWPNLVLSLK